MSMSFDKKLAVRIMLPRFTGSETESKANHNLGEEEEEGEWNISEGWVVGTVSSGQRKTKPWWGRLEDKEFRVPLSR